MPLYVLFVIFPLLELWVFVDVAGNIGFFKSLLLLILSGFVGTALVRQQGFATLLAMNDALDRGKVPLNELFDGFCIVAAGVLFIFPGFISDVLAILLLLPRLRGILRRFIRKHPKWYNAGDSGIIEGEYIHIAEENKSLPPSDQP